MKPLYHVTRYRNAANILKHNYFRPTHGRYETGLSTTLDPHYWWGSKEVRFVLDSSKLSKDYKLVTMDEELFTDKGTKLQESEVLVLADSAIKDAKKYIIRIEYVEPNRKDRDFDLFINEAEVFKKPYKKIRGEFMKEELKTLYKKDKALAVEIAEALGYKIKAKEYTDEELNADNGASFLLDKAQELKSAYMSLDDLLDKKSFKKVPKEMIKAVEDAKKTVDGIVRNFNKIASKYSL